MQHSTRRILTTHAGSLPRPKDLLDMLAAKEAGQPVDEAEREKKLPLAVKDVVQKQIELGIDVVDDGEYSKPSFVTYVNERLGGFEIDTAAPRRGPWVGSREEIAFPEFYSALHVGSRSNRMVCTSPVTYKGQAQLQRDLKNLKAALGGSKVEAFVPAISPSNVEEWQRNAYYKTDEDYLYAIGEAMREEYKAIADAGFLLQIDDPRLVSYYLVRPGASIAECRKWANVRVEALNHALRGIPRDRIRHHTCYGINMGPRVHDMEVKHLLDIILKINAGAYSFEAANPRHEHEWKIWGSAKLPKDSVLIPGVISHSTVLVEHPELIAERIARFASLVGKERVIAGSDCGFATFAGSKEVHPSIVWAKLQALTDGAKLASRELWRKGGGKKAGAKRAAAGRRKVRAKK
ncbi:MAG: cobalamin-independent methionine synthase II family protein [Alphaproteobacteria bacterium]|nr:cobalamin-independent methionine synthase II family protein [Alphaproteobacteria bacterium]